MAGGDSWREKNLPSPKTLSASGAFKGGMSYIKIQGLMNVLIAGEYIKYNRDYKYLGKKECLNIRPWLVPVMC